MMKNTVKGGLKPVRVRLVDAARNLEDVQNWKWDVERQRITIPHVMCDSVIWLVDFNG